MIERAPWPTIGYLRHLFVVYAIAWGTIGLVTLIVINLWFSPFYTSILLFVAVLGATPFVYRRWHRWRSISVAGE